MSKDVLSCKCISSNTVGHCSLKVCIGHRSHDVDGGRNIMCDFNAIVEDQIMYFLVTASPKPFDIATSNFAGA